MITTPEIIHTDAQLTACIALVIPRVEIQNVMGPGIQELMKIVAEQGTEITGPWFTHHFRRPTDTFDFEICVPVSSAVTPSGRVYPSELLASIVARTIYSGPSIFCSFGRSEVPVQASEPTFTHRNCRVGDSRCCGEGEKGDGSEKRMVHFVFVAADSSLMTLGQPSASHSRCNIRKRERPLSSRS
jgi:hypothetical protein